MPSSATTTTVLDATDLLFNHDRSGPPQVDGVSFKLRAGKTLGVLGGNECGKTTLAQLLLGTLKQQRGAVALHLGSTTSTTPRWLVIARAALALLVAALAAVGAPLVRAGGWAPALLLPGWTCTSGAREHEHPYAVGDANERVRDTSAGE